MTIARITIPYDQIAAFCRKWHIVELALFGSVLRDDFRPDSDVDMLVTFEEEVHWPWGGLGGIQEELEQILGRKVDVLTRAGVEQSDNSIRRRNILNSLQVIYTAG